VREFVYVTVTVCMQLLADICVYVLLVDSAKSDQGAHTNPACVYLCVCVCALYARWCACVCVSSDHVTQCEQVC